MKFLNIPIALCEYVIRNNFYRPLQLYIYLKVHCSGKIKFSKGELKKIGDEIGLTTTKAVRNNLDILLEHNWIGYNRKTKWYFVRGFEYLRQMYKIKSRSAAKFNCNDIRNLKGFLAGAKIQDLINEQKKKRKATEPRTRGSKQIARPNSSYYPVANKALAKTLGVSISTAHKLKQLAFASKYIDIRKKFVPIRIDVKQKDAFKKSMPEIANKVRVRNGKLYIQDIDQVACFICFKKRKKLETYTQGK